MWLSFLILSIATILTALLLAFSAELLQKKHQKSGRAFRILFAGVFVSAFFLFFPIHKAASDAGIWGNTLLSLFTSMQIFTIGTEFEVVEAGVIACPDAFRLLYRVWAATLFVAAPVFTFGFVLSLFKNLSAYLKYLCTYFRHVYVFSELNNASLTLAKSIKDKERRAAIVFTDVFEENEESDYELSEQAKELGAICFKKDILNVAFRHHSKNRSIAFFTIGKNETENLDQTLCLIETYRHRKNTRIYAFSTKVESELLLTAIDKGEIKVRRINEVQSLINRILYERGELVFQGAVAAEDGVKDICAVVVGMGNHGTEMVKALTWFGQMDGYRIHITAFDQDPLAEEKFRALAPELLSDVYNRVYVPGEAQYDIRIRPGFHTETAAFASEILQMKKTTYIFVSLGNDDVNIKTAVYLRMLFARAGCHPVIQAVVYNSQQKNALCGIQNYRGQAYDIEFIGDIETSYTSEVIIDSDLEEDALNRHLKWGKEEEFWAYEYNYRSSVASAIHVRARVKCGIPGAEKQEAELTEAERLNIEVLEHRRWNAYMRAEGYVYSGSPDKSSRNDLAKMHHDLVDYASLTEEEKRKDGVTVGSAGSNTPGGVDGNADGSAK